MSPTLRSIARAVATISLSLLVVSAGTQAAHASPPGHQPGHPRLITTAHTPLLTTWWQDGAEPAASGAVAADKVRQSPYYGVQVATTSHPSRLYDSFAYMSIPRNGNGKVGYTDQDGAEFSSSAGLSMSWSSFQYSTDVWVDVKLKTHQPITSADQVTIRPNNLGFKKVLVNSSTIRIRVPYKTTGYRFSVEFQPQLMTAYNDMSSTSGQLTTDPTGNRAVDTEPKNSMLIFANPTPGADTIPTERDGSIYRPEPGLVNNLDSIKQDIIFFGPGTYYMGADYHAVLPASVKWVYLAPGAYVKGAFRFLHDTQSHYKVTGLGVLSGEQYVYEPDTANGYKHTVQDECHVTCVKMLQFESSNTGQTLDLQGLTVANPPYHSFVVYAHDGDTEIPVDAFHMNVSDYKQVGSWYWQTDGIELYSGSTMSNTFFHSNDDVLKMYHSDVTVKNTVIWKNENGPVIQWGWVPRDIDDVHVDNTDVIHNRMYWKDVKYNTCVFNSSSDWQDMGATDTADPTTTVKNMTFTNTRVEGAVNCGIRIFALSNMQNIVIDGFSVDAWNGLDSDSQASLLKRYTDASGAKVTIGDQTTDHSGLLLHDYTVGGVPILKAGNNWASDELGRLDFDADTWDDWDATATGQPTGPTPTLSVDGLADGSTSPSRDVQFSGTTNAKTLSVAINGTSVDIPISDGAFDATIHLPSISNKIVVTATSDRGVMNVVRRTVYALGTELGSIADPTGDDNGPGSYTYPTDSAFNAGSLDLTGFHVYRDGDTIRFVATTAGQIGNPWGGNGMSTQRVNIYVRDGDSTATTPLLPGTDTSAAGAWKYAVVADGRYDDARFSTGLYGADLSRVAGATLQVIQPHTIVASIPAAAFGDTDLAHAAYQVSMFSDAEDGEGIGNVRPVYSSTCWQGNDGCPSFVQQYRFGGGAGDWTDAVDARDTDTSDSNAIDIISGTGSQAEIMRLGQDAVVAPYVDLAAAEGTE